MSDGPSLHHLAALLPLGVALLALAPPLFARRGVHRDNSAQRSMIIAGWTLIHVGMFGVFAFAGGGAVLPLFVVWLIVSAMAAREYRMIERRALLAALATAAEKGLPLEQAARAFAEERCDDLGVRAARLAEALERGAPLPEALATSKNALPLDAHLAAAVGWQVGNLGAALNAAVDFQQEFDHHLRAAVARFFYLLWVIAWGVGVVTFIMLKIIPAFAQMFAEFEVELPGMTVLLIDLSQTTVQYWYLLAPLHQLLLLLAILAPFYYMGWLRWEPPLVRRLWRGAHTACILQTLANVVRQRRPIDEGLRLLAATYPRDYIGHRLLWASWSMAEGRPWPDALHAARLIGSTDAAVFRAAERAGNLPWAMEQMAESHLRRLSYRLRAVTAVVLPAVMLTLAIPVFLFVVGLFLPLIRLTQALT